MVNSTYDTKTTVGHLFGKASRELAKQLQRRFNKAGHAVTAEQWVPLMILWRRDGLSQQEIADATDKDKTTITRLVNVMEKRDLVVRVPDKKDRRQKLIYLTNKGRALEHDLMAIASDTLSSAIQGIEREHLAICEDVLEKIRDNLCNL
jgi:DNA-binding MarR family transcriptional regulator